MKVHHFEGSPLQCGGPSLSNDHHLLSTPVTMLLTLSIFLSIKQGLAAVSLLLQNNF